VQTNEPELEDAQLAHEQVETSATQLKPEHSPVRTQLDEKDAEERLAKGPQEQTARPRSLCSRLALDSSRLAVRFKKTAMATASVSSLPHPDSHTSTAYPTRAATPTTPAGVNCRRAHTTADVRARRAAQ
ncbi:hypothetical protein EDB85DRAFT_1985318, partial [Lactarius pseudohatsudake]